MATLIEFLIKKLTTDQATSAISFLKVRYNVIGSNSHIFSIVIDPLVGKARLTNVPVLLDDYLVLSVATAALEHDLGLVGKSMKDSEQATRILALNVFDVSSFIGYGKSDSLWLWWSTKGTYLSSIFADTAFHIFCLLTGSDGIERTSKIQSHVYERTRVSFSNNKAYKQFKAIYNSLPLCKLEVGVLATKRYQDIYSFPILSYKKYINGYGLAVFDIFEPRNDSDDPTNLQVEECTFDLDDDDLFAVHAWRLFSPTSMPYCLRLNELPNNQ